VLQLVDESKAAEKAENIMDTVERFFVVQATGFSAHSSCRNEKH
jgi:hypothetical protein